MAPAGHLTDYQKKISLSAPLNTTFSLNANKFYYFLPL